MIGPNLPIVSRVHEPRFDTNAIPRSLHAPLEYGRDAQRLGNLAQVARTLLVVHHRGARNDPQVANPAQLPEQLIVEALRKVRVLLAHAEAGEGQDRDRPVRVRVLLADSASQSPPSD